MNNDKPKVNVVDTIKQLQETMRRDRKWNAKRFSVEVGSLKSISSDEGRVVITTRESQSGEVVHKDVLSSKSANENGIPLPNPLTDFD